MAPEPVSEQVQPSEAGPTWWRWMSGISPIHWFALLILTALAVWVRIRFLEGPMRYDEAFTVWRYATNSLPSILADYSLPNNHVFHTLLVHLVVQVGGIHPEIVRIPALIAGVLIVPVSFLVIGRIAGLTAGLLSSALTAGSSLLIDYSTNARGYMMAAGLSLLAFGLAAEIRRGWVGRWAVPTLVGTGLVGSLGLWTVPVFAYPWAGVLTWLVAPDDLRTSKRRFFDAAVVGAVSIAGALILYTPVIINDGLAALTSNRFVTSDALSDFLEGSPGFLLDATRLWIHNLPSVLLIVLTFGSLVSFLGPRCPELRRLAWSLVIGVVATHFVVRAIPPPRVWVVLVPLILGISAAGLGLVFDRLPIYGSGKEMLASVAAVTIALLMVGSVVRSQGSLSGEDDGLVDAERIVVDLQSHLTEADYVAAVIPSTAPLRYYFELHGLPTEALRQPSELPEQIYVVTASRQTVPGVLEAVDIDLPDAEPELLSSYESGSLWQVRVDP